MAETTPGIGDLLNLLGTANPLAALTKNIDTLKKGVEGFVVAVQTFTRTMEALEEATKRITTLMDDVEIPVRSVIEQLGSLPQHAIPQAIENLNRLGQGVSQLLGPLSGVAGLAGSLFGGLRPQGETATAPAPATPPAAPPPASAATAAHTRSTAQRTKSAATSKTSATKTSATKAPATKTSATKTSATKTSATKASAGRRTASTKKA